MRHWWHSLRVRRFVPWALLGLVAAGAVVAAVAGATSAPGAPTVTPSEWDANLLAPTARAGTAHFTDSSVSTSRSAAFAGSTAGNGDVDFRSADVRATEVQHQTEFTTSPSGVSEPMRTATSIRFIGIGASVYQSFAPAGFTALPWAKMSWHRDPSRDLGLATTGIPSIPLDELGVTQRVVGVRDLGATTLRGVATSRYEVSTVPVCAAPRDGGRQARRSTLAETVGPSYVWVDSEGRLVQIVGSVRVGGRPPAALEHLNPSMALAYPTTTTDILRLSDFGAPVRIRAPPVQRVPYSSSVAITLTCRS
jgi:hypothetical protein